MCTAGWIRVALLTLVGLAAVPLAAPGWCWQDWTRSALALDQIAREPTVDWRTSHARALAAIAVIAQEDRRLFERSTLDLHLPVDPRACGRALVTNLRAVAFREGCSTLAMQLAGLAMVPERATDRSLGTKLLQVRLAFRWVTTSPDLLVAHYLDRLECGTELVSGLEGCAMLYFGRRPDALDDAEIILLATAVQAPARDLRDPKAAAARVRRVLQTLVDLGWLPESEQRRILGLPLGLGPLHAGYVRAAVAGRDLGWTALLERAAAQAGARLQDDDLALVGAAFDADGEILASAGAPGWLRAEVEAGSWIKPWCIQSVIELDGVGPAFLEAAAVPLRVPMWDRSLRRYQPRNASHVLPPEASPAEWLMRSSNTGTLASVLMGWLWADPTAVEGRLATLLSPDERAKLRTSHDLAATAALYETVTGAPYAPPARSARSRVAQGEQAQQAAPGLRGTAQRSAAGAGRPSQGTDGTLPLPGFRELSLGAVRACLARVRVDVPSIETPGEDLAAMLGVAQAPLREFGSGFAKLWLHGGELTPLAQAMASWGDRGTLASVVRKVPGGLPYKTATAVHFAGAAMLVPVPAGPGMKPVVVVFALMRPSGAPIAPYQGASLAPALERVLDEVLADAPQASRETP